MPPVKKRRKAAAAAAAAKDKETDYDVGVTPNVNDDGSENTNNSATKLLQQHRKSLDTMLQIISKLSSSDSDSIKKEDLSESILSSSLALANLKSLQRQIALQVETQTNESKEQRAKVEECSLMLENLRYEKNYLQREIASLEGWKADELEKMAWAELGRRDPPSTNIQSNKNDTAESGEEDVIMGDAAAITSAEDAINTYLFGVTTECNNHNHSTNHTQILQKLQSDMETRASLVTQLSDAKSKLKELQKKRDELSGFLNHQIPSKLREMERGAESLNAFFGSHGVWNDVLKVGKKDDDGDGIENDAAKKIREANMLVNRPSLDRSKRFQLAKSNLSPPLYVLYVQLVGYQDAWASLEKVGKCDGNKSNALGGFVGSNGMNITVEKNEDSDWKVVLSLSISGVLPSEVTSTFGKAGSANSRSSPIPGRSTLSISFSFDDKDGVVYASVDANSNKDVGEGLLDNLFPDDDGSTLPNISLSLLKNEEEEEDESNGEEEESNNAIMDETESEKSKKGKAYYWCQVLSGLDFPPPSVEFDVTVTDKEEENITPFQIQICTKAVMRQLLRRIRARQTLSSMVDYLGRRGQFANPIPIHPIMRRDDAPAVKAKLQSWSKEENLKRYTATIKRKTATLKASVTISENYPAEPPVWSLQNEDGSVGSSSKSGVIVDASLHRIECHVNQELEHFVREDIEATYDWILIHQLADIVSCWDESKDEGNAGKSSGFERIRKGRDRKLIGFGEKSPFFWYRNGL